MGVAGAALKLMPMKGRIRFVLNGIVSALKKTNPQVDAWVEKTETGLPIANPRAPSAWGGTAPSLSAISISARWGRRCAGLPTRITISSRHTASPEAIPFVVLKSAR